MKIFLDCLPCMLRQVLEGAQMATGDEQLQKTIMDKALKILSSYEAYSNAPELSEVMHNVVKECTGIDDPYGNIKKRDIEEALKLEPIIRSFDKFYASRLMRALKISATGNVMDSAMYKDLDLEAVLKSELEKDFMVCDIDSFEDDIKRAKSILIIGDNAGEVVFDKVLVEYLSRDYEVVYAVRDRPIINDATLEDAYKTGIQDYCRMVSTGCGAPGAVLDSCSSEFLGIFNSSDIVISKGQGNFEALSDSSRRIYFLLKAKCHRIAKSLDVDIDEYVFKKNIF